MDKQLHWDRLPGSFLDNLGDIYGALTIDKATMNCFNQTHKFVMDEYNITEAEAATIITQGVDFAVMQVADGNGAFTLLFPSRFLSNLCPMLIQVQVWLLELTS